MINFRKHGLKHQKPQLWIVLKIPNVMHEKCMKTWNKMQKEGQKGLTGLGRQKPCKNFGRKRQKNLGGALAKSEREESLKSFWKSAFEKVQFDF